MTTLDDIACRFGTDKSSLSRLDQQLNGFSARSDSGHGYSLIYANYFEARRLEPIRMLEIGVLDGRSLATWAEYFPNARLYGLDIDPACARFETDRTRIFIGSQADPAVLADLRAAVPEGFDVVIDDGSHYVSHMKVSFRELYPHVSPGGIYVIEDIHTAALRDWGSVAFNEGMARHREEGGNDPAAMMAFLHEVRGRSDVRELILHLKKLALVFKPLPGDVKAPIERGDRIEDLYPRELALPLPLRVARRLARRFYG